MHFTGTWLDESVNSLWNRNASAPKLCQAPKLKHQSEQGKKKKKKKAKQKETCKPKYHWNWMLEVFHNYHSNHASSFICYLFLVLMQTTARHKYTPVILGLHLPVLLWSSVTTQKLSNLTTSTLTYQDFNSAVMINKHCACSFPSAPYSDPDYTEVFYYGHTQLMMKRRKKKEKKREKNTPTHCFYNPVKIFLKVSGCHISGCIAMKWWGLGCQYVYGDVRAVVSVLWCSHYQVLWSQFWTREYWNVKVLGTRVLRCRSFGYWGTEIRVLDIMVMGIRLLRWESNRW